MNCPRCDSSNIKKNGSIHNGKQKYQCKDCNRQFVLELKERLKYMVKFIVHGGYSKTATTFLQKKIFPYLGDVLYFGKQDGKIIPEELNDLYHIIFPSGVNMHHLYRLFFPSIASNVSYRRTINSSLIIPLFGDILLREMKKSGKNIILLSNESLFDFAASNAELNMLLLLRLFNYLQTNYSEKIKFKVMMTIRNQKNFLQSFYADSFSHLKGQFKSFEDFIQYGIKNNHEMIFGGCYYDLILEDMKKIYGQDNVRFFVYEKMKEDTKSYLHDIFQFIGTDHNVNTLDYNKKVNVNSKEGVHKIIEIRHSLFAIFIWGIYQHIKPILSPLESIKIFQIIKKTAKSYRKNSRKLFKRGEIKDFPNNLASIIDDMYKQSNNRLSKMLDINLEEYGYIGGYL